MEGKRRNTNGEEEQRDREKKERNQCLVAVTLSGTRPHRSAPWFAHTSLASHRTARGGGMEERWTLRGRERKGMRERNSRGEVYARTHTGVKAASVIRPLIVT